MPVPPASHFFMLIYDVNNWVRVKMAESLGGCSIFSFWQEIMANHAAGEMQLFVADGKDGNRIRRRLYSPYKMQRKPADASIYDGINFFKELLVDAPKEIFYIEVDGFEADDVIANIAYNYSLANIPVVIISTDKDLTQLQQLNGVLTLGKPKTEPRFVRLYKMLVGDSSDNIPGVKGFGEKSWEKTSEDFRVRMLYLFMKYPTPEEMPKDYFKKLCELNMPTGQVSAMMAALENGELHTYYKIIGFFKVPENLMNFKYGTGRQDIINEKMKDYRL